MIRYRLLFIVIFCATAVVLGGVPPGYAQEEDDPLEFRLEDVTVTALKREMDHQKVPIQMEVISGADLVGTGYDNVDEILREISSVIISKYDDGMRVTLRGLGDDDPLSGGLHTSAPSVAVNIDGAYTNESTGGQNLFDIERMEVMAGPQSTLYGSNSPGGIINVVTASPKTDRFEARASAEFGNHGTFDGQVMLNVPILKDRLAMRLSTQWYQRDSWMEGNENSQETKTFRLKTKFEPSDTFDATLTLNYSEAESGGRLNGNAKLFDFEDGLWANEAADPPEPPSPVTNPWTSAVWENPAEVEEGGNPNPMSKTSETTGIRADIVWDTAIGTISFIPYYSERASEDFRTDVEVTIGDDPTIYTTQVFSENFNEEKGAELRIVSPEDFPFEWIIGGTLHDADANNERDDLLYDSNDRLQDFTQDMKAVYANVTYPFTDQFRGTLGFRYSWDDVKNLEIGGKKAAKEPGGRYLWGQEYSAPDYKVGVEYDLSQENMVWANWATSYKVDPMAAEAEQGAEAQTLDAYSVGIKNRFFNDKLQLNATAFFYDYKNKWFRGGYQARFPRGMTVRESDYPHDGLPGTDFNYDGDYIDTNIPPAGPGKGKAPPSPGPPPGMSSDLVGMDIMDHYDKQFGTFESTGVDISMDWLLTRKDRVNLSVSYLDSEWTDAVVDFYWSWVWPDQGHDFSGSDAILTPDWTVHASYEHRFDLGSFGTLIPKIDFQYKDDYILAFNRDETNAFPGDPFVGDIQYYNPPWNAQEAHWIWNASLAFNHSSGKWSARAYIKNIEDYAAKNSYGGHFDIKVGLSDPQLFGVVVTANY